MFGPLLLPTVFGAVLAAVAASTGVKADETTRTFRLLVPAIFKNETLGLSAVKDSNLRTAFPVASCPALTDPKLKDIQRVAIELMIHCRSLMRSGLADTIELVSFPNSRRAIDLLQAGRAEALGVSLFASRLEGIPGRLQLSDSVLRIGEFQLGLHTTPNRKDVLAVKTVAELKALRGVTVSQWVIDLKTMKSLGLAGVVTTGNGKRIPGMIAGGRADFTFSYLKEAATTHLGAALVRLDGFKASLQDERIFVFSPSAEKAYAAMQKLIRESRSSPEDPLAAAYRHAGFIVDEYRDWIDVTRQ